MLSEFFCLLFKITSSRFSHDIVTAFALVFPEPVAASVYFLSFSDFYVLLMLLFAVSYQIAHLVTYITYVINVTDRVAADSKTWRSLRSHPVAAIAH